MTPIESQAIVKRAVAASDDSARLPAQTCGTAQAAQRPNGPARAWVGVVSRAHVQRGVVGGFAQLCHGKRASLDRMRNGDALVYYSPTTEFRGGSALQAFTALGVVLGESSYPFDMGGGFIPFRRQLAYAACLREVPLRELAPQLHFVQSNPSWGMLARRGHFEIDLHDFELIATAMHA
jgi:EVE domain-containing protein